MILNSNDNLTIELVESGVVSWEDLTRTIQNFKYGRNSNRHDVDLVWRERKGTCSSKHAFLKKVADLNGFENVKLKLGFFKMSAVNTPKVATILKSYSLEFIPEAHCYLKINKERLDFTFPDSNKELIESTILKEEELEYSQVTIYKVNEHKHYIQEWLNDSNIDYSLDEIWEIREKCIKVLES